jgi:predicted DNA-binding transcriptional regulator YafY
MKLHPHQNSEFQESGLVELSRALSQRSSVTFTYKKDSDQNPETRKVNPLGLSGWRGSWYLVAEDLDREDIRVFKLSRITSAIEASKKRGTYQIPSDFDIKDYLIMYSRDLIQVSAAIRKGAAPEVRRRALSILEHPESVYASEWDIVTYSCENMTEAIKEALWLCDSLVALSPTEFRKEVQLRLEMVHKSHG